MQLEAPHLQRPYQQLNSTQVYIGEGHKIIITPIQNLIGRLPHVRRLADTICFLFQDRLDQNHYQVLDCKELPSNSQIKRYQFYAKNCCALHDFGMFEWEVDKISVLTPELTEYLSLDRASPTAVSNFEKQLQEGKCSLGDLPNIPKDPTRLLEPPVR